MRRRGTLRAAPGRAPWPPVYADPFPDVVGVLPEIDASALSAEFLGGAVAHHGGLVMRGIFNSDEVARAVAGIHRAEAQAERPSTEPDADAWYRPYTHGEGTQTRAMVRKRGGIWLADSPTNTAAMLDLLGANGVIGAVADHLGERPLFSLQKSTLRHSLPINNFTGWHQDGSFLSADVRTMNVWIALSACGGDRPTPGLEVVPKRMDGILPTEGGFVSISVTPSLIDEIVADTPAYRPLFEPGDGLMFDERFLHRTYLHDKMTEDRYTLECWLFAPSHASDDYLPFVV